MFSSEASRGLYRGGAAKLIGKPFENMVIKDDPAYVGELFGLLDGAANSCNLCPPRPFTGGHAGGMKRGA